LYQDFLFPGVICENWQMMECERIALTGVLARIRPRGALEVGVYYGGSLSLTAQYCERILAIDIDPAVRTRFTLPDNVGLMIGDSRELIPQALSHFEALNIPVEYVLIDADHSVEGVRRDLNLVLKYRPKEPMVILCHDSGNPECREGILAADWHSNPHVHFVQCDFVPGQIIEHSVQDGKAEVWGGLALGYLDPEPRTTELTVAQGSLTQVRAAHYVAKDVTRLKS
jgi:hypothetical protein